MKKCSITLILALFLTGVSYAAEQGAADDSLLQRLFRSQGELDELESPITSQQRIDCLKKGSWYSALSVVSGVLIVHLLGLAHDRAHRAQRQVEILHELYDIDRRKKAGKAWDKSLVIAVKDRNSHAVASAIFALLAGGVVYYNWKQKTVLKAYRYLKRVIE